MDAQSNPSVSLKQLKVWTLMAATLVVGILIAFGRWAGANRTALDLALAAPNSLPAEWALAIEAGVLAWMIAAAVRARRLRRLLASRESLIWLGAVFLLTAGFFRYQTGIWGANMSMYGMLSAYVATPSISGLPLLLFTREMPYGAIALVRSFSVISNGTRSSVRRCWIILALFLVVMTVGELSLSFLHAAPGPQSSWLGLYVIPFSILAALATTVVFTHNPDRKLQLINLITAVSILPAAFPGITVNGVPAPISQVFPSLGPGYALLVLGEVLILVGSLALLLKNDRLSGPAAHAEPDPAVFSIVGRTMTEDQQP